MDGNVGLSAALHPYLAKRPAASRPLVERLEEELVSFAAHRGLAVDEESGRRVALVPASSFDPELAWAFVADHLITHLSWEVEDLRRMGRLLARAFHDAGVRGAMDHEQAKGCADAVKAAILVLPRLDALARSLRALPGAGRPGRALYESDPAAYASAMRRWEAQQPLAQEELEGGFLVTQVGPAGVRLQHRHRDEPIDLALPQAVAAQIRPGDRLDMQLGCNRGGWFLLESWVAAAPAP